MSKIVKRKGETLATNEKPMREWIKTSSNMPINELLEKANKLTDEELGQLNEDEISALMKNVAVSGRIIGGSDRFITACVVNLDKKFMERQILISMVGYLFRKCSEYHVPDNVPVVSIPDYLKDKSILDTPKHIIESGNKSALYDWEFNRRMMEDRIKIYAFLETMFQFNPVEHVRSEYKPNFADTTREVIETPAALLAMKHLSKTDEKFAESYNEYAKTRGIKRKSKFVKVVEKRARRIFDTSTRKERIEPYEVEKVIEVPDENAAEFKGVPENYTIHPKQLSYDYPHDPDFDRIVRYNIPPQNTYYEFERYSNENAVEIRKATIDMFSYKPFYGDMILPCSHHDSEDDAKEYVKKYNKHVIAPIYILPTGRWNFIEQFVADPDYIPPTYSKDMQIFEGMIAKLEEDNKLGYDIVKHRIRKEKTKSEMENGKDDPAFKKWQAQNRELEKMGAKHIGDTASLDTPDNAIEVDVIKVAKGGVEVVKDKFHSLAQKPVIPE
jgi:hypothetical protein